MSFNPESFHRLNPQAGAAIFSAVQHALWQGLAEVGASSLARGLAAARRDKPFSLPAASAQRELPLGEEAQSVLAEAVRLADAESSPAITEDHLEAALRNTADPEIIRLLSPPETTPAVQQSPVPLVVLGLGKVGRSLIQQILAQRDLHGRDYGLFFELRGVADSSGSMLVPAGESDAALQGLIDYKAAGYRLAERPDFVPLTPRQRLASWEDGPGLIADCTAAETSDVLLKALEKGWGVALANKKPLTQSYSSFQALTGETSGGLIRWEATVGAGLPVTTAVRRLAAAGDRVESVAGSVSSTLGYVTSGLAEGKSLSQLVEEVAQQGYTEPDPREDLSGRDVARKALILARTLGWPLETADIQVDGLLPRKFEELSLDAFWAHLPALNDSFEQAVTEAAARGETLRYGFRLDASGARVGRVSVSRDSPMGRLTGTNQLVEIHSLHYCQTPLVIQGRGVGVQATAAGVLADLVELARYVFRP